MSTERISLLLIEDSEEDTALFESLALGVSALEIEITAAEELEIALNALEEKRFDLIVSDLDLPDAKGLEAIQRLSKKAHRTPILVLTGAEDDEFLDKAAGLGVYDYLYKSDLNRRYLQRSIRYTLSRYRVEKERESLRGQLNHSQKMEAVGQLTGGIAHDFNNKLAILQGNIEVMSRVLDDGESIRPFLGAMESTIQQSARLTSQLLAFGRKQEMQKTIVDLNDLAKKSVRLLSRLIKGEVELCFEESEDLFSVEVDANQMDQILMNLVLNARDALQGQGKITIGTENVFLSKEQVVEMDGLSEAGDYVCLSVADNGMGMSEEIQKKIFEPFFTTKEIGKGTGLGLSVVHGIIAQHDGAIALKSQPGEGTRFDIYFKKTAKEIEVAKAPSPIVGAISSQTILYVEDEFELSQLVSESLRQQGFEVVQAENGLEAFEIMHKDPTRFDLVITDAVMPKMTGMEFFKKSREILPDIPFIFVSGYSRQEITAEGQLPSLTRFLSKPCSCNQLVAEVGELLKEKSSTHSSKVV